MKAYVLRVILGLFFLGGISAETLAQCTSTLSFGAAAAPVTSLDSVLFSPCVFFTDFATVLSVQAGNTYAITMSSPTYVSIYNGSNLVPANLVTSGMASNTISFMAPASGNYEVVFYANATCPNQFAPGCQTARVSCTTCPAPIETDSCQNATIVSAGTFAFTNLSATGMDVSSCTTGDSLDVWVRYSPPTSGTVGIQTCQSGFNTSLQVFDGCPCAGGNELACNDNRVGLGAIGGLSCAATNESSIQMWMHASSMYYIRLSGAGGVTGTGRFTIIDPVAPGGSLCSSALLLQDGVTLNTNLSTFTGSFSSLDQLCSNGGSNTGMFFRIPVTGCGDVDITISHATSSFNWFLLSGDCSGFAVNSSNSANISTSGCGTNSVNFRDKALWMRSATPGSRFTFPTEYVLYVEASGQKGPLSVTYNLLNSSPRPPHDDCDSAYVLSAGDGFSASNIFTDSHSGSVSCANTDASDNNSTTSANPSSGCSGGSITWQNSLWYAWTAPASQLYTLNIFDQTCIQNPQSTGNGLQFMVTTIKDCKDPARTGSGAISDISGNSCYSTGTTTDLSFTFQATANTTYYILIDGFDGAMCGFEMLISEDALFPTGLHEFEGRATPNGNLLEWKIGDVSEQLLAFDIQRSSDGAFFETIGKVEKNAAPVYTFLDENQQGGVQYYRLKLITLDGRFNFSNTLEIYNKQGEMALYAHEGGQSLQVLLGVEKIAVRLEILTATGQQVYIRNWAADADREQFLQPNLPAGVYFYRLSTQQNQHSGKFITN
jgi:hypothetical protein